MKSHPASVVHLARKLELITAQNESELQQRESNGSCWSDALVEGGYLSQDVCAALESLAMTLGGGAATHDDGSDSTLHRPPDEVQPVAQASRASANFDADATLDRDEPDRLTDTLPHAASTHVQAALAASLTPLRYKALRSHAEGGLGRVLVAIDTELQREVALKEIKPAYADDITSQDRFVIEAEVTGKLEHPGIVPVYGLGRYADGRPYYAMRFIRGRTLAKDIHQYHQEHGVRPQTSQAVVAFRQLLRRFVDVCNAIEYAHSRGVVHRDLKPANVMLGDYGETLVVDWGLAKAQGARDLPPEARPITSSASSESVTHHGEIMGTPAFMPPEQARGDTQNVGPPADIFSLGATLYMLLTNRPPHQGKDSYAILGQVIEGKFASPREINPRIARPLDAICLKAMALQPQHRYASARQLAEDVEAWLADEPVSAYRERFTERLARWIRRHRTFVLSAAVALVLVSTVSALAAFLINDARRETAEQRDIAVYQRREAVARFQDARDAVDTWLTGMSDALKHYPGMQETRVRLLEKAAADYERFVKHQSDNPEIELERGRALVRLGDVQRMLGTGEVAERSYRQARALLETLPGRLPGADAVAEAANSRVRLALLLAERGDLDLAQQELDSAEQELAGLPPAELADALAVDALGSLTLNRGAILLDLGERDAARKSLLASIDHWDVLLRREDATPRQQRYAALANVLLAQIEQEVGQHDQAIVRLTAAGSAYDTLLALDRGQLDLLDARAATYINLALSWKQQGQVAKEADCYREAIEDYRKLTTTLPEVPRFQENLALTQNDLAISLIELEQFRVARETLEEVHPVFESLRARFPNVPRHDEQAATAAALLGHLQSLAGESESAAERLRGAAQSMADLSSEFPDVPAYRHREAIWRSYLAQALAQASEQDAARDEFELAAKLMRGLLQQDPQARAYPLDLAQILALRGGMEWDDGQADQAERYLKDAHTIYESQMSNNPTPAAVNDFVRLLNECPVKEMQDATLAKTLMAPIVASTPHAAYRVSYAAALFQSGETDAALTALREAIASQGESHAREGFWLAQVHAARGDAAEAQQTFDTAEAWREKHAPGSADLKRLKLLAANRLDLKEQNAKAIP